MKIDNLEEYTKSLIVKGVTVKDLIDLGIELCYSEKTITEVNCDFRTVKNLLINNNFDGWITAAGLTGSFTFVIDGIIYQVKVRKRGKVSKSSSVGLWIKEEDSKPVKYKIFNEVLIPKENALEWLTECLNDYESKGSKIENLREYTLCYRAYREVTKGNAIKYFPIAPDDWKEHYNKHILVYGDHIEKLGCDHWENKECYYSIKLLNTLFKACGLEPLYRIINIDGRIYIDNKFFGIQQFYLYKKKIFIGAHNLSIDHLKTINTHLTTFKTTIVKNINKADLLFVCYGYEDIYTNEKIEKVYYNQFEEECTDFFGKDYTVTFNSMFKRCNY